MIKKIEEYINEHKLIQHRATVLVAISGGADSVALLHILKRLGYKCHAIHCNFHLRNEESMRDEYFVRDLCKKFGTTLKVVDFDTMRYSLENGISIEMAAREQRYDAFEEERKRIEADCIAVAHHRDDSAETLLMNLIRGTGIKGLHGIRPKNGNIVRPLLAVNRSEIINYLKAESINYVTDSTNLKSDFTRNKIRLEIIPLMQQINPAALDNIAYTAENISRAENIYNCSIMDSIRNVKKENHIDIDALKKEKEPTTILHEILSPLGFNSSQTDDIHNCIESDGHKLFSSKSHNVIKDRNKLIISKKDSSEFTPVELKTDGRTNLPNGFIETTIQPYNGDIPKSRNIATLDIDTLRLPLTIRRVREGDRFRPFGMNGSKLISDYLTDIKKSFVQKKKQLVVTDCNDTVVWLVDERPDARFSVSKKTLKVMSIRWEAQE